jgi:predicted tellurium resistance membrane protein TerC
MPAQSQNQPIAKRHIKTVVLRIGSSLIDSAVDRAFGLFLLGVAAIVTPITIAIWLYVKSGRATWVYPYLYFTLGCAFMCLVLIALASLLFTVQARRRRALEKAKNLKFISHEKGFLDHMGLC